MHGPHTTSQTLESDGTPPPLFPVPLQFFIQHRLFFFITTTAEEPISQT